MTEINLIPSSTTYIDLESILGYKPLQLFINGGICNIGESVIFSTSGKCLISFQKEKDYKFLILDFSQSLYELKESKPLLVDLQLSNFFNANTSSYKLAISLDKKKEAINDWLVLNKILIVNKIFTMDNKKITFTKYVVFETYSDRNIILEKGDNINSFFIHIDNNELFTVIQNQEENVSKVTLTL